MPIVIFFGANPISFRAAKFAREQGLECVVVTDAAQAKKMEHLPGQFELIVAGNPEDLPVEQWFASSEKIIGISVGAPWIFKQEFISGRMKGMIFNLHGTHLPRSRGGTIFSWQIMSGQRAGMSLLHQMTEVVDAGPVIDYEEYIYPASCRKPVDYIRHYEEKNVEFLQKILMQWQHDGALNSGTAQPEYLSTYWPRLQADVHGWLDWTWTARDLECFICAFDEPYDGARCRWRGQEIVLRDAWSQSVDGHTHPFQWGLVTRNNGEWINVAVQGGELLICSVLDINGKNLLPAILPGDRFFTLPADREKALQRIIKTAKGFEIQ